MNNIDGILNSLNPPTDGTSPFNPANGNPVSGNGSSSNGNSFGNILNQVAAQNQNSANNPGAQNTPAQTPNTAGNTPAITNAAPSNVPPVSNGTSGTQTSITQTSIAINESLKVDSSNQLAQAEQALVSLATGLAGVLNALSNIQSMNPQQLQSALASVTGGNITAAGAQGLLNAIQALEQKMPASQNPLLLSSGQQGNLLVQMFQQMLQNQQIQLGTSTNVGAANNATATVNGIGGASGIIETSDALLQIAFSDANLTQAQQAGAQGSQVFINLQNFQMSANFIQLGGNQGAGQNSNFEFKPLSATNGLLNSLSQAVNNFEVQNLPTAQTTSTTGAGNQAAISNPQAGSTQNLQNLVQLLMQSGVGQAALTTFLNQQPNLTNDAQASSLAQNINMDQIAKSLVPNVQIPPVTTTDSATLSTVKNGNPAAGAVAGAQTSTQSSVAVEIQNVELLPAQGAGSTTPVQAPEAVYELQANIPMQDQNVINSANDAIARLNLSNLQGEQAQTNNQVTASVPSSTVDQLLSRLAAISPTENQNLANQNLQSGLSSQVSLTQGGSSITTQLPSVAGLTNTTSANVLTANLLNSTAPTTPTVFSSATTNQPGPVNPAALTAIEPAIPNSANLQLQTTSGAPVQPQGTAPISVTAPPVAQIPVSSAPNVSASAVTGEAIKNAVTIQNPTKSDLNNTGTALSAQFDSAAKPATPEAVAPLAAPTETTSISSVSDSLDKNASLNGTVLQASTNAFMNMGASQSDKSNSGSAIAQNNAMGNVNSNIESAQILNQISDQVAAQMASAKTISRLNFQLIPESLGRVTVQIALVDQAVSARIIVTNPDVREVLHSHLVDLKSALNQAGLQIDHLQVQVQGGGSNLLAQYYQYQQEGFGYQSSVSTGPVGGEMQNPENTGVLGAMSSRAGLVDILA